jgi:integrase
MYSFRATKIKKEWYKMKKQPIRDLEVIENIKMFLRNEGRERDRFLFVLGINTGRRIGDLIQLKVKDVRGKDHLIIKEQKTKKGTRIKINHIKKEIIQYTLGMNDNDYLFPSRQKKYNMNKHICYERAYQIFIDIFKYFKIKECATHTLRKTFGYFFYKRTKDLEALMKILNHSSQRVTRIYIGVEADELDKSIDKFGGI